MMFKDLPTSTEIREIHCDNGATMGCSYTVYIDKLSYKQRQDE